MLKQGIDLSAIRKSEKAQVKAEKEREKARMKAERDQKREFLKHRGEFLMGNFAEYYT